MKMKRLLAVLLAAALLTAAFALPSVSAHETGASPAIGDIDYEDYEENPTGHCTEVGPSIFLKSESNFADDYYQPVVEDFELDYYLKKWCKKNGFKVISCEGDGDDSGFEPDSVRRWIKYET